MYGACTVLCLEKVIECDTEKATNYFKLTHIDIMEDLNIKFSNDHLAEALLQLREAYGPESRWTPTGDADPVVGRDPIVVGKSKLRLPWVLLKTFTGPTSNEDAMRIFLPIA